MNTPLLDPLILDTLVRGGRGSQGLNLNFNMFTGFSFSKFILNFILPFSIFLFMAFFLKLKWDRKRNKNNLNI